MSIVTASFVAFMYALEFAAVFGSDIGKCPIEFSSKACLHDELHGCDWHGYAQMHPTPRKIVINHNHWKDIEPVHRRELIWHELGHCVYDLRHSDEVDIMRPRVYSTKHDGSNWDYLVKRLALQIQEAHRTE